MLDLKSGLAVAAIAGDRDRYGLIRGAPEGCNPLAWARRFRDLLHASGVPGAPALYVADLDAIEGQPPHLELFSEIAGQGVSPWVDAGVRTPDDAPNLLASGVEVIVVGLETVAGPGALAAIVEGAGPDRVCFGLDLHRGRPLVETLDAWGTADPLELCRRAVDLGARTVMVLDLARIGTGRGTGTEPLIRAIRSACPPGLRLIAGGGVSGPEDLNRLGQAGAAAALVGSALRDGRLSPADLRALALGAPCFPRPPGVDAWPG
ncbi:1-(5-phosphoribosyl)-5-[(5-phosphoribosylamino)methylideneamino] imidazole-4-carboxamide isomerase [Tautonia plasticadhaerens]|uniref:1-(5-phosphoribosyl)-5-[(5-phosphoribosylamino)methylideneamino] imidazole-4-carboxamide isomerase n=1 Tax=Tautonia plasticadhaerens TaxID=2527974 RepID=A0A518GYM7_9BACT|nr:1-(5-phosphoribosyl)-5-[(5-phosphoribosylamino)methylideneamino] imidazole-4-carboxamide isomerase [Tautonia plasticadhaerens]